MKRHVITALLLCMALCLPAFSQSQGEGTDKPMLDIVWLVDTTGSMDAYIKNAKNHMDSFHNVLKDSFDVRYGLAPFGDVTVSSWASGWDWPEVTKPILMNGSKWTSAVEVLKNHLEIKEGCLPRYWGEDTPETSTNAIITAVESYDWRPGAIREIVLVTNAKPKDAKEYTVNGQKVKVYSLEEVIPICQDKNVSVCLADANSCSYYYSNMIPALGGISKTYDINTSTEPIALWIYNTPLV
ncbi:MAG: VWA domain-containing protein, partial [Clostridia bacterium]|nr:VWA domain-containing protein [Clostridia bacterium]